MFELRGDAVRLARIIPFAPSMKSALNALLCLCAVFLCSCGLLGGGGKKKKKSAKPETERTLGQRLDKPNLEKRSRYEKMMTSGGERNIGSHYQKQMHHSGGYGTKAFNSGQNWHKVNYAAGLGAASYAGQSFQGGSQASQMAGKSFDTSLNSEAGAMSRENRNFAREGGQFYDTNLALPRSQREGKFPKIIENRPSGSGAGDKTYSEDEIKRLLGRP